MVTTEVRRQTQADQAIWGVHLQQDVRAGSESGIGGDQDVLNARGVTREGVNREKLTVKKIINNEMFFFFSPFASLINREKSA